MKTFYTFISVFLCSVVVLAAPQKAYVRLDDGVERYIEYTDPKPGRPWIVFVNGLVYNLERWNEMDKNLEEQGYGILHYYFRGQDLTLSRETEQFSRPLFFKKGLESTDFADELNGIISALAIKEKVIVVGLSYGSHIAATFAEKYPERVDEIIFMAPLVVPLEQYRPDGQWLDWNLDWARVIWGPQFYEYAYRQIYIYYLESRVDSRAVPRNLEDKPEIYRESLFFLIRSVRNFDLKKYKFSKLSKNSVHYMVAKEEEPKAFQDQLRSFEGVDKETQGSLIWFPNSAHAIPDSAPRDAAYYLNFLIARDSRLEQGKKYKSTEQGLKAW